MEFKKVDRKDFAEGWRYQIRVKPNCKRKRINGVLEERWRSKEDETNILFMELFLKQRALGQWTRDGSLFHCNSSEDVFKLRFAFGDEILIIHEAIRHPDCPVEQSDRYS